MHTARERAVSAGAGGLWSRAACCWASPIVADDDASAAAELTTGPSKDAPAACCKPQPWQSKASRGAAGDETPPAAPRRALARWGSGAAEVDSGSAAAAAHGGSAHRPVHRRPSRNTEDSPSELHGASFPPAGAPAASLTKLLDAVIPTRNASSPPAGGAEQPPSSAQLALPSSPSLSVGSGATVSARTRLRRIGSAVFGGGTSASSASLCWEGSSPAAGGSPPIPAEGAAPAAAALPSAASAPAATARAAALPSPRPSLQGWPLSASNSGGRGGSGAGSDVFRLLATAAAEGADDAASARAGQQTLAHTTTILRPASSGDLPALSAGAGGQLGDALLRVRRSLSARTSLHGRSASARMPVDAASDATGAVDARGVGGGASHQRPPIRRSMTSGSGRAPSQVWGAAAAVSDSGSGSGSLSPLVGPGLLVAAVTRAGSASGAGLTPSHSAARSSSAGDTAAPSPAAPSSHAASATGAAVPATLGLLGGSPEGVARAFAEAFVAALASGNVKWASSPQVAGLIDEGAKLLGLDRQLYVGRTAILRRLNGGVEQLINMLGGQQRHRQQQGEADTPFAKAAAAAAQGLQLLPGDEAAAAGEEAAAGADADAGRRALRAAAGTAAHELRVSTPREGQPGTVRVEYCFRLGGRRFTLQDDMLIKRGRIVRIRRIRG